MPPDQFKKIISGGQTGVDRGALEAALQAGFPCGGWCPPGRRAEDGVIPERYPLREIEAGGYRGRTLRNVLDGDATLILYRENISGGTLETLAFCIQNKKAFKLIDAAEISAQRAAELLANFLDRSAIKVLNVAGPRESGWKGAQAYTRELFNCLFRRRSSRRASSSQPRSA